MSRRFVAIPLVLLAATALRAEPTPPAKALAECVEIALRNHPTLGSRAAATAAGRARARQAVAGYLPSLDGSWATSRTRNDRSSGSATTVDGGFVVAGSSDRPFNFHSTGLSLSQMLFDFGRNLDAIRAAQARTASLEADEDTQRQMVVFDVKQSYFDLLAARRLLAVAEETMRSSRAQLEQAEGRNEVGLAPRLDVTRSQVQLANAELDRLTARNNVAVAEETLRNALGLAGPLDFDVVDVLDADRPAVPSESEALAAAYEQRPELRSLRALQLARERDAAALRKDYLPYVTGNASYDWAGQEFPLERGWSLGASLNLSLSNGGRTTAEIAEANAELRGLRFDLEALRQDIALEVRQAVLALRETEERIGVSQRAAEQARENLLLADGRYRAGVGSVIELTDAEATRASAEADAVRALYQFQTALAALEQATGRPVPAP